MKHIYIGIIPGIFGYGISVASKTQDGAFRALRKAYAGWKEVYPDNTTSFVDSFEYYGGRVEKVELDKAYHDDFNS